MSGQNIPDVNKKPPFARLGRSTSGAAFTEESFGSAQAMTAGAQYESGGKVYVNATAAGAVTFELDDLSTITVAVVVGGQFFPFRACAWTAGGGAAATVYNLR